METIVWSRLNSAIEGHENHRANRPYVTLTYAQTIDGSISAIKGQHLVISSRESLRITHQLRTMHEGILVGVGTVFSDNPNLTARLYPGRSPVPIIVDPHLRIPLTSNVLKRQSIVICSRNDLPEIGADGIVTMNQIEPQHIVSSKLARLNSLQLASPQCIIIALSSDENGRLAWSNILTSLNSLVRSIMIEGGANVISSLIATLQHSETLVDHMLITVSPTFVGGARAVEQLIPAMPRLHSVIVQQSSSDAIIQGFTTPNETSPRESLIQRICSTFRPLAVVFMLTYNSFALNSVICRALRHLGFQDTRRIRTRLLFVIILLMLRHAYEVSHSNVKDVHIDARTHVKDSEAKR